jgi:ABC-type antimicrobial peptide transport system permease subunit
MRPVAVGLGAGVLAALALSRLLSGALVGVEAHDVRTFAWSVVLLALAAGIASVLPALRAIRVDPVRALRAE